MAYIIIVALAVAAYLVYRRYSSSQTSANTSPENTMSSPSSSGSANVAEEKESAAPVTSSEENIEETTQVVVASEEGVQAPDEVREFVTGLAESDDPLVRHRLYQQITDATYKNRNEEQARETFRHYADRHISEFDSIKDPLAAQNNDKLPHVATFQNYANVLTEDGEYEKAVQVCEQALAYGLDDKTRTGFEGRIERIRTKAAKV